MMSRDGERDDDNVEEVIRYYNKTESRLGYDLVLGGTKHFGYYSKGDRPWDFRSALRRMEEKLAHSLELAPGSLVLDAGCGVGEVAVNLASRHGLRVVGIDILDFNLTEARKRARAEGVSRLVEFREMSYAELELPADHFDGVYTMETLVHAASAAKVLRQFWRVLKPGGRLVLFEYSRAPDAEMPPRCARVLREINEVAAMPSFQRFEHGLLEGLVEAAGFSQVKSEDITERMLPMIRAFAVMGAVPYAIGVLTGKRRKVVNAMSAVEFWRYRRYWRYNVITAAK